MEERRASLRQRTFKGGTIPVVVGAIDCIIRNLSKTGACIEVPPTAQIPENFTLIIRPQSWTRSCQVAWRNSDRIGVAFM
jgi:hypothetical protein